MTCSPPDNRGEAGSDLAAAAMMAGSGTGMRIAVKVSSFGGCTSRQDMIVQFSRGATVAASRAPPRAKSERRTHAMVLQLTAFAQS